MIGEKSAQSGEVQCAEFTPSVVCSCRIRCMDSGAQQSDAVAGRSEHRSDMQ